MGFADIRRALIVAGLALSFSTSMSAQFTAKVINRFIDTLPGGVIDTSYRIVIEGDTLLAITRQRMQRIDTTRIALAAATRTNILKDSIIAAHEPTLKALQTYQNHTRAYVTELEAQIADLRELSDTYKKLSNSGAWITLEGAIGASGPDTEPAILAGIGIRRLRIYGLLQKDNLGGMIGMSFPIW